MHEEVLSSKQRDLLPIITSFNDDFGLIGGTAIALQLGHRRSIDFDLATLSELNPESIRDKIGKGKEINAVLVDETNEYSLVVDGVRLTFLRYPYKLEFTEEFGKIIKMPDIASLAAMKAYALGRRAKWKDYVDLYFVISKYSLAYVTEKASAIFGNEFNEKLFREQLAYFEDIDYSEEIDYMEGFLVTDEVVKKKLTETSLEREPSY
jgi:hypothetical protein